MAKSTSLTEERRTARLRLEQLVVFSALGGGQGGTDRMGLMSKACFCFFWPELLSCFGASPQSTQRRLDRVKEFL